jgi:hypothetical protein
LKGDQRPGEIHREIWRSLLAHAVADNQQTVASNRRNEGKKH